MIEEAKKNEYTQATTTGIYKQKKWIMTDQFLHPYLKKQRGNLGLLDTKFN